MTIRLQTQCPREEERLVCLELVSETKESDDADCAHTGPVISGHSRDDDRRCQVCSFGPSRMIACKEVSRTAAVARQEELSGGPLILKAADC